MSVTHFERIQVCCEDVYQSASLFSKMLGQNPDWSGQYRLIDNAGRVRDHGTSVWFALENTRIELCSSAQRNMKPGIAGVVLGCDPGQPLQVDFNELHALRCVFSSVDGGVFEEEHFMLDPAEREGFLITLIRKSWNHPLVDVDGDIQRVDHLVLHSHSAEACIERFGEPGLGMRLALDQDVPQWGGRMLFFRCGKLTLEVIVPVEEMRRPDYFWGLAYQSRDMSVSHQRLSQAGVEVSDVRDGRKPGTQVCTLKSHTVGIPSLLLQPVAEA